MLPSAHILIIDDDDRLRDLIGQFLQDQGFMVSKAASIEQARDCMANIIFDLLVVDIMLPGESGLDFVRSMKSAVSPNTPPCLMLTAMGEPGHRLHGLESGADDYMTKPFEPLELSLRIKNILAHRPPANDHSKNTDHSENSETDGHIRFGRHGFDTARLQLTIGDKRLHLTTAEKDLLACFGRNHGQVLSRDDISAMLGGQMEGRSIDVAVARLRRKIESDPKKPVYLLTVRGRGWVLETDHYINQ